jgi:hypothetical protein
VALRKIEIVDDDDLEDVMLSEARQHYVMQPMRETQPSGEAVKVAMEAAHEEARLAARFEAEMAAAGFSFAQCRRLSERHRWAANAVACEWVPDVPKRGELTKADVRAYQAVRNKEAARFARETGINIGTIDV